MKITKTIMAFLTVMTMTMGAVGGAAYADEKTNNNSLNLKKETLSDNDSEPISMSENDLPDWVPQDFESAVAFRNSHGATYAKDGYVAVLVQNSTEIVDTELGGNEAVKAETYESELLPNLKYKVKVYKMRPRTKMTITAEYLYGGCYHETHDYIFETDHDGNTSETDYFSWVPDCSDEYDDYITKNAKITLRDGIIVYCSRSVGDHYDYLDINKSTSYIIYDYYSASCEKAYPDNTTDTGSKFVKIFVPRKTDAGMLMMYYYTGEKEKKVDFSWTVGHKDKNGKFIEISDSGSRSYKIDENDNFVETFNNVDWLPGSIDEYNKYLETHEPISVNGDYIIYCHCNNDRRKTLTENYDRNAVQMLVKKTFTNDDIDDGPVYHVNVYRRKALAPNDETKMTWHYDYGNEKYDIKEKSFKFTDGVLKTVKFEGDADNDGSVTFDDVKKIGEHLAKKDKVQSFENSDMNGDGTVNIIDCLILKSKMFNNEL